MAYAPHTSTSPLLPFLYGSQPIAGPKNWGYISSHTRVECTADNFFSDAQDLGIKAGDLMFIWETSTADSKADIKRVSSHRWILLGSTFSDISIGVVISSAS